MRISSMISKRVIILKVKKVLIGSISARLFYGQIHADSRLKMSDLTAKNNRADYEPWRLFSWLNNPKTKDKNTATPATIQIEE